MRMSELRVHDVVNVADGKRLGVVDDLEVDPESGRIAALVIPVSGRILGLFGRPQEYVVPWSDIVRIGADVILVDVKAQTHPV